MKGELIEVKDYSTKAHRMQITTQNTYFNKRFGRSDFKEIDEKGKESTYTWCKDNFYMVDTKSEKINPGYPLNSISKYKGLDKYFTEVTDEDLETVKVSEEHVVDFIAKNI